jgi:hypothetical protein
MLMQKDITTKIQRRHDSTRRCYHAVIARDFRRHAVVDTTPPLLRAADYAPMPRHAHRCH